MRAVSDARRFCCGVVIATSVDPEVPSEAPGVVVSKYAGQVFIATAAAATLTVNATAGSLYWSVSDPVQESAVAGGLLSVTVNDVVSVPPPPDRRADFAVCSDAVAKLFHLPLPPKLPPALPTPKT